MGKLIYFDVYGRAESIRYLLAHAKVQYEEQHVQFSEWPTLKATMPSGQVPVWIDEHGHILNQTIAILNALAHEHGYAPKGFHGVWAN